MDTWDRYFLTICLSVSTKSPCLSRKIGALLVRDHSIVSTGYNGPARGIPHCGRERVEKDPILADMLKQFSAKEINETCPRRLLGFKSSEGLEWCGAKHAEENAVVNAARVGASTIGCTCYLNTVIPCQACFGTLINAGVVEIVVVNCTVYDKHTQFLVNNSNIKIREFKV